MIESWLKSTDQDFYPIEYAWRKGEHPKRGFFNPDFFIKVDSHVLVVEIKEMRSLPSHLMKIRASTKQQFSIFRL